MKRQVMKTLLGLTLSVAVLFSSVGEVSAAQLVEYAATESTEALGDAEVTETTETTETTESTEATEAVEVTDVTEETESTETTESTEVTEATETTESTEVVEETEVTEATEATEVIEETEVTEATETTETVEETEATEEEDTEIEELELKKGTLYGISQAELDSSATTLTSGKTATGALSSNADEKWFKFNITQTGYFKITFGPSASTDTDLINWGWDISLYKKGDLSNALKTLDSKSTVSTGILVLETGTYYIKVNADYAANGFAPVSAAFDVRFDFTADSTYESEANDTNAAPDTITLNKVYHGSLYKASDADWYKITTNKNGYFQVTLGPNNATDVNTIGWGWDYTIYDSSLKEIKSFSGIKTSSTSAKLPYIGTYYIKVNANYAANGYAPVDAIYDLKVAFKENSSWESEYNNSKKNADTLTLNKKYSGIISNAFDEDWYKITVKATGKVSLKFTLGSDVDLDTVNGGWDINFYNSSTSKTYASATMLKGSKTFNVNLKKGTYYVQVKPWYSGSAPVDCTYTLKASYSKAPSTAKITKVTGAKKKVTIKWDKVKNASGYYVYRSTSKNGTYKKIATIKKNSTTSYTDKKSLKSKKTYYYKIVTYHTDNNVTANGSASKVKSAKTK